MLEDALAVTCPFEVKVSVAKNQVSMWIDGFPVHGMGKSLDECEESFLIALEEYAEQWVDELHVAPNHRVHGGLVRRGLLCAGDREQLRRAVFDEANEE